jgi:hypothetical protein
MIDNELLALEHKEVRLKKLSVKPYQNSNYPSGICIEGELSIEPFTDWDLKGYENLSGYCVLVCKTDSLGYIKTSPIQRIIEKGKNYLVVETHTSFYQIDWNITNGK